MCNWCNKKTIGVPQVSGFALPMTCEHCGSKIDKKLDHANCIKWVKEFYERYIKE